MLFYMETVLGFLLVGVSLVGIIREVRRAQ